MKGHVILRATRSTDALTFGRWSEDPIFVAHAEWRPTTTIHERVTWWQASLAEPDPKLTRLTAEVDDGVIVGSVDLYGDEPGERELGSVIGPSSAWGHGLGTLAARAGLEHGFAGLGMTRIWAEALEANVASIRVLEKIGMRCIGHGRARDFMGSPSRYRQFETIRDENVPDLRRASPL